MSQENKSKFIITDWGGKAEVLGESHKFSYREDGGRLAIYGLTETSAKLLLSALSLGGVPAVQAVQAPKEVAPPEVIHANTPTVAVPGAPVEVLPVLPEAAVEAPKAEEPVKRTRRSTPKPTEADTSIKGAEAAAEAAAVEARNEVERQRAAALKAQDEVAPAPPPAPAPPAPPPAPAPPAEAPAPAGQDPWGLAPAGTFEAPSATLIGELKKAARLGEVLGKLIDAGYKPAQLVEVCTSIKGEVPVLSRVPDMAERVPRTLKALEIV